MMPSWNSFALCASAALVACAPADDALLDGVAPDFALSDENPNSASFGELISPRDHLEKVSGWYFFHAT